MFTFALVWLSNTENELRKCLQVEQFEISGTWVSDEHRSGRYNSSAWNSWWTELVGEESQISVGTLRNVISQHFKYRKTSARRIQRELSDHHKEKVCSTEPITRKIPHKNSNTDSLFWVGINKANQGVEADEFNCQEKV